MRTEEEIGMLQKQLAKSGIEVREEQVIRLQEYMRLVLERNGSVNLTSITDEEEFIQKHYIDSLSCARRPEFQTAKKIIDVGTGAGFPGVPLAICFPDKEFTLIDSLRKRTRIVEEFCGQLQIGNVRVMHGRAEELARQDLREQFDLCVSRAVANLSTLCELCLPFVRKGGWFISYKGPSGEEEAIRAERAIGLLGGKLKEIDRIDPEEGMSGHQLIIIKKTSLTNQKYPRRPGLPGKEPL